jgi:hypothetical protein
LFVVFSACKSREDFAAMAMKERLPSVATIVSMLRFG